MNETEQVWRLELTKDEARLLWFIGQNLRQFVAVPSDAAKRAVAESVVEKLAALSRQHAGDEPA